MESYKKMLANVSNTDGRTTRKDYWVAFMIHILFTGVAGGIMSWAGNLNTVIYPFIELIVCAPIFIGCIAVFTMTIRRLHDVGKSGWWILWCILLNFLFFIGGIVYIVFMCSGSAEDNEWGPNPQKEVFS